MVYQLKRRDVFSTIGAAILGALPRSARPAERKPDVPQAGFSSTLGNTGWRIEGNRSNTVIGYPIAESILPNDTLRVRIRFTTRSGIGRCHVSVYRVGYDETNQDGLQFGPVVRDVTHSTPVDKQDARAAELGLAEATRWDVMEIVTDETWRPGFYVIKLEDAKTGHASQAYFVLRTPIDTPAEIMALVPFNTAQAYNNFGNKSLYAYNSTDFNAAYGVSYNRPLADGYDGLGINDLSSGFSQIWSSFPTWYWLETLGYNVAYVSDTDFEPAESGSGSGGAIERLRDENARPRILLVAGHSEYWSDAMLNAFVAARDGADGLPAVNLMFLCGNSVYWRVRFE